MTIHAELPARPAPVEVRCRMCGGWIATAPAGTSWVRGRCMNRRCPKYGVAQQIKAV